MKHRNDPIAFIDGLKHTKGKWAGEPFSLQVWQKRIIRKLFKRRRDGLRQYRQALVMLPRKNGKTQLMAGVALYMLMADGEVGAEVYSAASDRQQASLVFNAAADMVKRDRRLSDQCEIIASQKRIVHVPSGSFYRAIPAEAHRQHGFNASCFIYDELHAVGGDRELWDVLTTSMGARSQPLGVAISTAGFDRSSILYEIYQHAKAVAENPSLDPTFLSILYEADPDADWTDERVWQACNPALGTFRSLEEMRSACAQAQNIPAQQNKFKRLYLNLWTQQDERWMDMSVWDACNAPVELEELEGRMCYAGLDLASTKDVTALVLAFPSDHDDSIDIVPFFWLPKESMDARVKRDRVPYDQWVDQGVIRVTEGNVCDYDRVRDDIRGLAERFDIQEIAYDRWGATQLVTQLEGDGAVCVPMGQGFGSMAAPSKEVEKLILGEKIRHGGNPVLRWMMNNVAMAIDAAGNIKPDKKKSRDKIDGVVAMVMAIDRVTRYLHEPSVYDAEDAEVFTV